MRTLFLSLAVIIAFSALASPALADYSDEQKKGTPEWAGTYFYPAVSDGEDTNFSSAEFILYCEANKRNLIDGIEPRLYIEDQEGLIDYKMSYAANPVPSGLGQHVDWYLVSEGTIFASKLEPGEYNLVIETHYVCGWRDWHKSEKLYKRPFLVVDPINISSDAWFEEKQLNGTVYLSSQTPKNASLDIYLFHRGELLDSTNRNLSLNGRVEEPFSFEVNNTGIYTIIAHLEDQYGLGYEAYLEIFIKPDGFLAALAGPFSLSQGKNKSREALFPAALAGFAALGSFGAAYYIIKSGSRKVLTSSRRSQYSFFTSMREKARQASKETMDALDRLWRAYEAAKERKAREKAIKDFLNDLAKLKELGGLEEQRDFVKALQEKYKGNDYIPETFLVSLSELRGELNDNINEQRQMRDNLETDLRKLDSLKSAEAKKKLIDAIIASYPLSAEFENRLLDYKEGLNSTGSQAGEKINYSAFAPDSPPTPNSSESQKEELGRTLNDIGESGQQFVKNLIIAVLIGTPAAAAAAVAYTWQPEAGVPVMIAGYAIALPILSVFYTGFTAIKLVGDYLQRSECKERGDTCCVKKETRELKEGGIDLAVDIVVGKALFTAPTVVKYPAKELSKKAAKEILIGREEEDCT